MGSFAHYITAVDLHLGGLALSAPPRLHYITVNEFASRAPGAVTEAVEAAAVEKKKGICKLAFPYTFSYNSEQRPSRASGKMC